MTRNFLAALLLLGALIGAAPGEAKPIAAVLVTDCGADMDDQWVIAHLLLSTRVRLEAVVATQAQVLRLASSATAACASRVVARFASDTAPPVVAGADGPLSGPTPARNAGVDALLARSHGHDPRHRLTVFLTGAATDIASALLADPTLADRIDVIAMGFSDWPQGGDEFNVLNDRRAWQVLLDSRVPLTIGSGAVARRDLAMTIDRGAALMRGHGALGEWLQAELAGWMTDHADLVAKYSAPGRWVVWDEVVVAQALGLTHTRRVPRPRLGDDYRFEPAPGRGTIGWITSVDAPTLWRDLTSAIDRRQRQRQ